MDRNLWIPSFTTGKNFSASRLFTQDASFLTFFLPFSLSFSFSFFFSLPSSWFDRSRGMQRAIYNASVFESISEENYQPIPLRISVYGFFPSPFLFVSAIHILSAVRNEQSFFLFNELVSAVFVFCTHLPCLFDKVSNSYRPYPSVERAWFTCILVGRLDRFSEGTITLKDCLQGWNDQWNTSTRRRINQQIAIIIFDRLHFPYFPRNSLLSWLLIQEFTSDSWSIR